MMDGKKYISLFLHEIENFSQKNFWVYVVFLTCLGIIFFTKTGSVFEILLVFLVYFIADLCMMIMVTLIAKRDYKLSSLFQLMGNSVFLCLFLYQLFYNGQPQYLLLSISFIAGTIKNLSLYHLHRPLKVINGGSLFVFNALLFISFWFYFPQFLTFQIFFQVI